MTPRSRWGRINGSPGPERSEKPYTSIRDPLPSTETTRSPPSYTNSCHVTFRSCDQLLYHRKSPFDMDITSGMFQPSFREIYSFSHYMHCRLHVLSITWLWIYTCYWGRGSLLRLCLYKSYSPSFSLYIYIDFTWEGGRFLDIVYISYYAVIL